MSAPPGINVIKAIEAGVAQITRRVEIYESDGVTPWNPDKVNDPLMQRLVGGSVSVDYTRDERRTLDMTLNNTDKLLRPNSNGGLWYDKVIKPFRGVTYDGSKYTPRIAIVEANGTLNALAFQNYLNGLGYPDVTILTGATIAPDVVAYDIIVSYSTVGATAKANLLKTAFDAGKSIITIGALNGVTEIPFVAAVTAAGSSITWGITPTTADNLFLGNWTTESITPNAAGIRHTTLFYGSVVATWKNSTDPLSYTAVYANNPSSPGRWFNLQAPGLGSTNTSVLMVKAIDKLGRQNESVSWETQMGEFCIDSLKDQNFPYQVSISGRDYTKRCLNSKLEVASTFVAGTSLLNLVKSLGVNSGIVKFRLPAMTEFLTSSLSFDRGTSRWDIMKQAANSFNYELYFDEQGFLVARKYIDPTLGVLSMSFLTGPKGNLVSFERSTNDSRLYNHIVVYGDPASGDEARLPYFGEAKNEDPSSSTRILRIGDRQFAFASTFFTSDQQCKDYALSLLKLHALETYEMNIGSIYYPWMEAGEIAEIADPDALITDPDRFLIDTITYPIDLGPMSWTGKRVTFVGSSV